MISILSASKQLKAINSLLTNSRKDKCPIASEDSNNSSWTFRLHSRSCCIHIHLSLDEGHGLFQGRTQQWDCVKRVGVSLWSNSLPQAWTLNLFSPVPWITTHSLKLKLAYVDRIGPTWKELQSDWPLIAPLFDSSSESDEEKRETPTCRQYLETFDLVSEAWTVPLCRHRLTCFSVHLVFNKHFSFSLNISYALYNCVFLYSSSYSRCCGSWRTSSFWV